MLSFGFMQGEAAALRPQRNTWIRILVLGLCALDAAIAFKALRGRVITSSSFERLDPYETTDSFLRILNAPHPGSLIEDSLRRYPPDSRLLFVGPSKEPFVGQVYFAIAHLAYPRRIGGIFCGEPGKAVSSIDWVPRTAGIDGVIFFEIDPGPSAAKGTRVTPKLYISPHAGPASWESFCR